MQVAHAGARGEVVEERLRVAGVAERGLAGDLDPRGNLWKPRNCILGDEMGLGKTAQSVATIVFLRQVLNIQKMLRKNRKILEECLQLSESGKLISKASLEDRGYRFKYHTKL